MSIESVRHDIRIIDNQLADLRRRRELWVQVRKEKIRELQSLVAELEGGEDSETSGTPGTPDNPTGLG